MNIYSFAPWWRRHRILVPCSLDKWILQRGGRDVMLSSCDLRDHSILQSTSSAVVPPNPAWTWAPSSAVSLRPSRARARMDRRSREGRNSILRNWMPYIRNWDKVWKSELIYVGGETKQKQCWIRLFPIRHRRLRLHRRITRFKEFYKESATYWITPALR